MSITLSALQKQRRDTAANWTSANPTLLAGELGYESDTGKWKVGDGSTAWTSLAYTYWSQISAYPLATADIANDAITGDKLANDITIANNLTVTNDLVVNGTTTTINSTTLTVDDKNIELGSVATPTDLTADGGGVTLKGSTDHTIIWTNSTDSWDFSEHLNIASGKEFRIAGTKVLDATSLGSAVVSSSLTSVGTITTGVWNGTALATSAIADDAVTADKLADTSVTAGSYTLASITVDAQGRLTAASSGTAADTDKITEGNTEAEVVDTGSDGHFKVTTEGTERVRIGPAGQVGIAGANYGTSGQVLTSGGASGAISWADAASGSILQVKQAIKTDTFSTATDGFNDVTGLSVDITPTSSSSKILVLTAVNFSHSGGNRTAARVVRRESSTDSVISQADADGSKTRAMWMDRHQEATGSSNQVNIQILDSPSTTNALTYKFQVGRIDAGTLRINIGYSESDSSNHARGISTITVMEVAA